MSALLMYEVAADALLILVAARVWLLRVAMSPRPADGGMVERRWGSWSHLCVFAWSRSVGERMTVVGVGSAATGVDGVASYGRVVVVVAVMMAMQPPRLCRMATRAVREMVLAGLA